MCRTIVSPRVSKRECIFPLAVMCALRSPISQPPNFNQHVSAKSERAGKVTTTDGGPGVAERWQRRSTYQKAEVRVVCVVLVFFNCIRTSPVQTTKCLRSAER